MSLTVRIIWSSIALSANHNWFYSLFAVDYKHGRQAAVPSSGRIGFSTRYYRTYLSLALLQYFNVEGVHTFRCETSRASQPLAQPRNVDDTERSSTGSPHALQSVTLSNLQ